MSGAWKVDDRRWMDRRRSIWKANHEAYRDCFWSGSTRVEFQAFKKYFLYGEDSPAISYRDRLLFDPGTQEEKYRTHILFHDGCLQVAKTIEALVSSRNRHERCWTQYGIADGEERNIVEQLLPRHYDHGRWLQQQSGFTGTKDLLSPAETTALVIVEGSSFLSAHAMNPFHPVQSLLEYWAQTLPHLDEPDLAKAFGKYGAYSLGHLHRLFRLVRFFVEPRATTEASQARNFRDHLHSILERADHHAYVGKHWRAFCARQGEALYQCSPAPGVPSRVLVSTRNEFAAMRRVVDAYFEAGHAMASFDPERLELVDVSSLMSRGLAIALGYPAKPAALEKPVHLDKTGFHAFPIPAVRYRLDLLPSFSLVPERPQLLALEVLHLFPAKDVADRALPRVLLVPHYELKHCPETGRPEGRCDHDMLRERQMVLRLEEMGIVLARADSANAEQADGKAFRDGCEHAFLVGSTFVSDWSETRMATAFRPWVDAIEGFDPEEVRRESRGDRPQRSITSAPATGMKG